ncbi:MAG: type II toxin-antitoxin system HicA family toxin [Opitutaceae bacterium]
MPKLPGIGQKDAVRVLEKRGFRIVRQGKHITLSNGAVMVQVPRHTAINPYTMGLHRAGRGINARSVSGVDVSGRRDRSGR